MNRRALLLASLATLSTRAPAWQVSSQGRRPTRRRGSAGTPARRQRSGLVASHVRTRIVNRTFTSAGPIDIPLGSPVSAPYPSTIQVGGFRQGRILKARVSLHGVTHLRPDDLEIMVVAPGNIGVILMSDAGGFFGVSALTLTFDQDAPHRVPDNIRSGTFQPTNLRNAIDSFPPPAPGGVTGHSLNIFSNRNPNGAWRLFIVDSRPDDAGGSLTGWVLHLRVKEPVRHQHRQGKSRRRAKR